MKFHSLLLVLLVFFNASLWAQNEKIEISTPDLGSFYKLLPLDSNGIFVMYKTTFYNDNDLSKWQLKIFDTAFYEVWNTQLGLNSNLDFIDYYKTPRYLYLLFGALGGFNVYQIDYINGLSTSFGFKTQFSDFQIEDFAVLGNDVFVCGSIPPNDGKLFMRSATGYLFFPLLFVPGYIPQRSAALVYGNIETGKSKDIDFSYRGYSTVTQVKPDSSKEKVLVLIKNNLGNESRVQIHEYKAGGARGKSSEVKPLTLKYTINDARVQILPNQQEVVIGTYSAKRKNGSQGVFFSAIQRDEQKYINYISFTRFSHFFDNLDTVRKAKLLAKIQRKRAKNKDIKLDYYVDLHDIYLDGSQYVLVGELYEPKYHTEYRITWYYGRPIEQPYLVFDGWNYTHAFACGLDRKGSLLWDHYIDINDQMSVQMNQQLQLLVQPSNYIIAQLHHGDVIYKVISKKPPYQIQNLSTNENRISPNNATELNFFYNNFFITYGIRNEMNEDKISNRFVVINKIQIENQLRSKP